jgi:leader peptidase (prepilin peptidase)/N-methyltransferase
MIHWFLFILGLCVGSFLNVLIDRLPKGRSISGRSYCDHCRHLLSWLDLIPIVSFFLLKGQCRYCGKKISWQYPLVELLTGVIFILIFNFQFSMNWSLSHWHLIVNWILKIGILSCLVVIFFSDLKYQIIPDTIQVALFIFSLLLKLTEVFKDYSSVKLLALNPSEASGLGLHCFIAGLVVMLPILFLYLATRARGMGFGDVKLSFTMGFLLGLKTGLLALYFGFVLGGIVGLILLLLRKKKLKSKIAFGPFLVLGIFIMLFWQKEIFQLMNKIYGF